MTTAERMKARRKEIGVSAEEIAKELKVSPATIYRYEKGDIEKMPLEILEPLSKVLRTTPSYLMGWEETSSESNIGKKINEMRKQTGLSLDEISERSKVPKGTLSKITAGITKNPSLETVAAIVHSLGYRLDDLDDYPKSDSQLSPDELDHIKKYRRIDNDGKKTVDMMLDQLVQKAEATEASRNDQRPTMVTLPLASRGGGLSEITVTEEAAQELEDAESEDIDF